MADTWVAYGSIGSFADGAEINVGDVLGKDPEDKSVEVKVTQDNIDHWEAVGVLVPKSTHPLYKDWDSEEASPELPAPGAGSGPAFEGKPVVDPADAPPLYPLIPPSQESVNPAGVVPVTARAQSDVNVQAGEQVQGVAVDDATRTDTEKKGESKDAVKSSAAREDLSPDKDGDAAKAKSGTTNPNAPTGKTVNK